MLLVFPFFTERLVKADTGRAESPIFIKIIKRTQDIFDQDTGISDTLNPHPAKGNPDKHTYFHGPLGDSSTWAEKSTHSDSNGLNNRLNQDLGVIEVWRRTGNGTFQKESSYPICVYTGTLGPKTSHNDYQTPEGFYDIDLNQKPGLGFLKGSTYGDGHAIDMGYPNARDRQNGYTGGNVEIHGALNNICLSKGCFGMSTKDAGKIYKVVEQALKQNPGTTVPVEIIPFPLTDQNLAKISSKVSAKSFWVSQLKPAYDAFESSHIPPHVIAVQGRYQLLNQTACDNITRLDPNSTVKLVAPKPLSCPK